MIERKSLLSVKKYFEPTLNWQFNILNRFFLVSNTCVLVLIFLCFTNLATQGIDRTYNRSKGNLYVGNILLLKSTMWAFTSCFGNTQAWYFFFRNLKV